MCGFCSTAQANRSLSPGNRRQVGYDQTTRACFPRTDLSALQSDLRFYGFVEPIPLLLETGLAKRGADQVVGADPYGVTSWHWTPLRASQISGY